MKKTFYATTALATAGLIALSSGDAFAQAAAPKAEKMKISIGGYMLQVVGYSENKSSFEKATGVAYKHFDQKSDTEIYFTGSLALDNGLNVGVVVQLEGDMGTTTSTGIIDESYLTIGNTTYGTLYLGATDTATNNVAVGAPSAGPVGFTNGDMETWLIKPSANAAPRPGSTILLTAADHNTVKYISPSIFGFQAAASYAASSSTTDTQLQPLGNETQFTSGGVRYTGKFGDVTVRGSGYYIREQGGTGTDADGYGLGADIVVAGFTVGGSWSNAESKGAVSASTQDARDSDQWQLGVKYAPGPWEVALSYGRSYAAGLITTANPDEDTHSRWMLGASYDLGPGVSLQGALIGFKYDDETNAAAAENKGWAAVTGVNVAF